VKVASRVSGRRDGPTVVLANSMGATWEMWDANLASLEQHFRVVRFDTRGHGRSPVPPGPYTIDDLTDDAVDLLDELGVERAHFVGLSLGGMTGLRLAARNPERLDRLVVLCTGARLDPLPAWSELAIAGAEDPATPPWQLERIAGTVADGKLLVVPEAAHLASAERPDVVTPAVIVHLLEDGS